MKHSALEIIPGLLFALIIAAIAYLFGRFIPVVGGPVFGITLGILVATLWKLPGGFSKGLKFTSKYILQLAVILLGFEMNMASVIRVGQQSIWVILLTLTAAFLTVILVGKALGIHHKLSTLIGVGTAICGGSAIAAASSAIDADDQDISYSISTIFLFNVIAVFLFPMIGHLLKLTDSGFGMWAGTAINDTSSVVAAAYSYSTAAGNFATVVKLTRSLMIVPVTLALALLYARMTPQNPEGVSGHAVSFPVARDNKPRFNLARVFPWFILGFLIASLISTLSLLPKDAVIALSQTGRFLIITAMAAIGLNTNLVAFRKAGPRALALGAATWFVVMAASLSVQYFSQMW
jgi:uncharacterized integral membrane protein (TIGR00698 family)